MKSLKEAVENAKRVYLCGNGGSAANAIHIANDLISVGVKAQALVDISTVTAIGNDFGYRYIFSKQIEVFGEEGDLLICLSGSGNSPNIIEALYTAKDKGMETFVITGGGTAWELSDGILTDTKMQPSEEAQLIAGHDVMLALRG